MSSARPKLPLASPAPSAAVLVKASACKACRYRSFAELTAVVIACNYLKKGRKVDARRVILSYLKRHKSSSRVAAVLRLAC